MHPGLQRRLDLDSLLADIPHHLPSLRFLYSVYVLIAFPLGKYRVVDRTADAKGKLQLTVFQCGSGESGDGVGESLNRLTRREVSVYTKRTKSTCVRFRTDRRTPTLVDLFC